MEGDSPPGVMLLQMIFDYLSQCRFVRVWGYLLSCERMRRPGYDDVLANVFIEVVVLRMPKRLNGRAIGVDNYPCMSKLRLPVLAPPLGDGTDHAPDQAWVQRSENVSWLQVCHSTPHS